MIIRGVEYVNIGTKEEPFYIQKPTEEFREWFTKQYRLKNS
jgi:hypothetical protein